MLLLAFTIGKPFGQDYDFLTTTQNKTPIFLSRNSVFALVWANRGPSPAPRQRAASPSPWERGVNGLANHRPTLICHPKILRSFANHSRTVASVPRPTIVSKAIHSPPSLDLWSLARARRGGGSREAARGWGPGWGFYAFLTKKYFFGNVCSTYHSIFAPEIRKEKPS